jgi:hypothetical protein
VDPAVCPFCKRLLEGNRSNEHVLPKWLLDHLGIRGDQIAATHIKNDLATIVSQRRHTFNGLVNGRICETCNVQHRLDERPGG